MKPGCGWYESSLPMTAISHSKRTPDSGQVDDSVGPATPLLLLLVMLLLALLLLALLLLLPVGWTRAVCW